MSKFSQGLVEFFKWLPNECPVLKQIVNSKTVLKMILKIIVMFFISFAWVWIAGLIWDLGAEQITNKTITMIFVIFCILFALALLLSIWAIVRFCLKGVRK